jgi:hypothetical protein
MEADDLCLQIGKEVVTPTFGSFVMDERLLETPFKIIGMRRNRNFVANDSAVILSKQSGYGVSFEASKTFG